MLSLYYVRYLPPLPAATLGYQCNLLPQYQMRANGFEKALLLIGEEGTQKGFLAQKLGTTSHPGSVPAKRDVPHHPASGSRNRKEHEVPFRSRVSVKEDG